MNRDEAGFQQFLDLILRAKNRELLDQVMRLFLTPEEIKVIGKRYLIIKALKEGSRTQRELASELNLSIAKITRGSNALKIIDKEVEEFLRKCLKK